MSARPGGWAGSYGRLPRTISVPATALDTSTAVEPCMCAWYQNVPAGWSLGMSITYGCTVAGATASSTLSLMPLGETWSPCVCRLVVLKQPTPGGSCR